MKSTTALESIEVGSLAVGTGIPACGSVAKATWPSFCSYSIHSCGFGSYAVAGPSYSCVLAN